MQVDGPASMRTPEGLGQVIKPDGSIVKSDWAVVVPKDGGLRSAYPVDATLTKALK